MKGHIRERSPGHWAIILNINKNGSRKRKWHSFIRCLMTDLFPRLINNQIIPHLGNKQLQKLKAIDIEAWHNVLIAGGRKDGKGGVSARYDRPCPPRSVQGFERGGAVRPGDKKRSFGREAAESRRRGRGSNQSSSSIVSKSCSPSFAAASSIRRSFCHCSPVYAAANCWRCVGGISISTARFYKCERRWKKPKPTACRLKRRSPKQVAATLPCPISLWAPCANTGAPNWSSVCRLGLGKVSDEDDLLFPTLEGSLPSPRAFSAEWADVAASIGMPDITFHALRHTHASQLIDAGVDVVTIAKRLGHSGPNITLKIYAHLFRDSDDKAAQAINDALAKLGYGA